MDQLLLSTADKIDHYRTNCMNSELNKLAREGQRYQVFPSPIVNYLQNIADHYDLTKGSRVIVLHPSADSGFPHTRPDNLICMPSTFQLKDAKNTLVHEACHLHQRANPDIWKLYCTREGWQPINAVEIPEKWKERIRINPDTISTPYWSWQDHYVPLPLFSNEHKPSLSECDIRWFDRRNRVLYNSPPSSFIKRYGTYPSQPEHPYELSAVEISASGIDTRTELLNILLM